MNEAIKNRIEQVREGITPYGFRQYRGIGLAPIDWKLRPLSDSLWNVKRAVPRPNEGYWRLGLRSHNKGTFHEFITDPSTVDMDELYLVEENDLVVNITFAWEHAVAIASKEDSGMLVSHRFPTYVFTNNALPSYFRMVIAQRWFREALKQISPGGAGRNRVMNKADFLKIQCLMPKLPEQQKIAEILTCCDQVISLKNQLLDEKRRQKKWLVQKLLDPDSGVRLQQYEGAWDVDRLDKLVFLVKDRYDPQYDQRTVSSVELENIESVTGRLINWNNDKIQKSTKTVFKEGDILFGKLRPYLRKAFVASFDGVCSTEIWVMRRKNRRINLKYLYYVLMSEEFISLASSTTGTKMPRAEWGLVGSFCVRVPSITEQEGIASILSAADREIDLLDQELSRWQQKKKALMQLLLTGIVRVNV